MRSTYDISFGQRLLGIKTREEKLKFLIDCACQAQNIRTLNKGKEMIKKLKFNISEILEACSKQLDFDDEYEALRFLELIEYLIVKES